MAIPRTPRMPRSPRGFATGRQQANYTQGARVSSGSVSGGSSRGRAKTAEDKAAEAAKALAKLQAQKAAENFRAQVLQAHFFLPLTLRDVGSKHGSQGNYWSSGRRSAQEQEAVKTRFELDQGRRDMEFAIKEARIQAERA